jgi:gliding motility-associated protein GldL
MKPGTKNWKKFMSKLYGIGASIVIIGALFKIEHWSYSSELLILGLGTEALIFFFSAFEPVPHSDPDWTLVYPQLATGDESKTAVAELDSLLTDANIDSKLLKNLGDGMKTLVIRQVK